MDLGGIWRATSADDDLRRAALGPDHDDAAWTAVAVPGHWRDHPEFASHDGPLLYRRSFTLEPPSPGRRQWIVFDGIFYQADVWLDGAYLGDPEGYFVPHGYDVTALTRLARDHVLAVEVSCPGPSAGPKRVITGAYQAARGPAAWNPGGISAPVRVVETGPVRITTFRVLCRDADTDRAHVLLRARLDAAESRRVRIRTSVDGRPVAEAEHSLAIGENDLDWNLDIDLPRLWWPRALGEQPLTDVSVEVLADGETSDSATRRTGLREVAWNRWTCSVNGERLHLKGVNVLPTHLARAASSAADVRRSIDDAVSLGLDVVRVHGHIARPELYDAADEAGVLVIQDFSLTGSYARGVRAQAVSQAQAAVDLLGHHPSIVMWIAHDDPGDERAAPPDASGGIRRVLGQQLPSWNRTVLDRWVKRAIEREDATRPCVPHSGVLPHLPQLDGTDSHLSFGWRHGDVHDLERVARRMPRLVRFVSEFGAQAVPTSSGFVDASAWPELDWQRLDDVDGAETDVLHERVPPGAFASFDEWRHATQVYQAELLRHHVETLRRLKYRPNGGFCAFALNDPAPAISASIIDHERVPKLGFDALARACRPVIVVADRPPEIVAAGERIELAVHVVNDLRHELSNATVSVTARWSGGERAWSFGGDVPADECVKAGTVRLEVPDTLGSLTFDLALSATGEHAGEVTATNRYVSVVTVAPA